MYKKIRIIISILIIVLVNSCYTVPTAYKFEIDHELYKDDFPKKSNSEYDQDMRFHNNYYGDINTINSLHFPYKTSNNWINIEHLVKLIPYDLEILPDIDSDHYLFTAVEFHKDLNIKEVELEHFIGKRKLKLAGTYIYKYSRNTDGTINYEKGFIVEKAVSNEINIEEQFIYVNIYEFPISEFLSKIIPKKLWFLSEGRERLKIKYVENGIVKIQVKEFKINWIKRIYWPT